MLNFISAKVSSTLGTSNRDIEAQQEPQGLFSSFSSLFSQQPTSNEPPGFFDGIFTLTRTQKIYGFILSLGIGVFCLFLCIMFLPNLIFAARKFAVIYALGNFLIMASTGFLIGFSSQIQTMFARERIIPTMLYFISTILTVVSAFQYQNTFIMLILIFLQLFSFSWYILTYIPFGQRMFSTFFSMFTSLF